MEYLPIFARLDRRPCLVVGGGEVALRKVQLLLRSGARVTVNAPQLTEGLSELARSGAIRVRPGVFDPDLISRQFLVIAATDDLQTNTRVYQAANRAGKLVNVVDDPARCSFIMPAIVDRSPLVVAISSGGAAPVLARLVRARLESLLPANLGKLAALARSFRATVKKQLGSLARRRRFWESVFTGPVASLAEAGRLRAARAALQKALARARSEPEAPPGEVWLVGAGPGDPSLLTLRALQLMQQADVILHDRLVSEAVLDLARRDAKRIPVGKAPGCRGTSQEEINALMIDLARGGQRVCRLKGGDPFIFGRGGEELEALRAAGIAFQVVPGITAAAGCAAYAGVPLTHRSHSQAVMFVTAHHTDALDTLDWSSLARARQTLAIYMGVRKFGRIRDELVRHGRTAGTPIAIIQNGTTPAQRVLQGTLGSLPTLAERHKVQSPAILIVGEVAQLAGQLGWFEATAGVEASEAPWQPATAAMG